ncbi:MAG: efflux RND transporter periplasmic adaptor subunit [Planctomycetota bacterium]
MTLLVLLGVVGGIGYLVFQKLQEEDAGERVAREALPAPVEVAPIEFGRIEDRRVFSGTLEAAARVTIAPKVGGRIVQMPLDIADTVRRGDVIALLDSAEYEQDVAQAQADLDVAKAQLAQAEGAAAIAEREFERVRQLHKRGIASDSQLDEAEVDRVGRRAAVDVAGAQVTRAEASLRSARVRLGYSSVRAEWESGEGDRVVAERFAEEGDTVSANTALVSIVDLDPIEAVVFATERDYASIVSGQLVSLRTDAYPDRVWTGRVARVSPVFREGSRQARVEITVPNTDGALKPGLFARIEAVLGVDESASIVPASALSKRGDETVVFLADTDSMTARAAAVRTGIRQGDRVQVFGEGLEGDVITLGHQLVRDGSSIVVPEREGASASVGSAR